MPLATWRTERSVWCASGDLSAAIATGQGPLRELVADVVVPRATVEAAGAQAAFLETACPSRTGTGRCARVSRSAPCPRARRGRRAAPAFPRHNPRLRLREVPKGRQLVEVVASHDSLLWFGWTKVVRAAGFEPATSWS